jgi:GH15 family glucan-1,4-alpha-glucosidase
MSSLIEDYALLSDLETAALVHRQGSIDWSCFPRFDSEACFARLLGGAEHGRWLVAPAAPAQPMRRYHAGSLVLETEWETAEGRMRVIDFMPPRRERRKSSGSSRASRAGCRCARNS